MSEHADFVNLRDTFRFSSGEVELTIFDLQTMFAAVQELQEAAVSSGDYISYEFAKAHALNNDFSARTATSTWEFIASRVRQKSIDVIAVNPREVKTFLYRPEFIISSARSASEWLNRPANSIRGFSGNSPAMLVSFANIALKAEPPVPKITR